MKLLINETTLTSHNFLSTQMGSLISFLLLAFLVTGSNADLIEKTCNATIYYDLCVSSLRSNASSSKADTKGLAEIIIGVANTSATATQAYLSSQLRLSSSATNDTALRTVLRECAEKYSRAREALQASLRELGSMAFDYAFVEVSAAKEYPSACRNAYRRVSGLVYPSELARREEGLERICDVGLGIIDLLGW